MSDKPWKSVFKTYAQNQVFLLPPSFTGKKANSSFVEIYQCYDCMRYTGVAHVHTSIPPIKYRS